MWSVLAFKDSHSDRSFKCSAELMLHICQTEKKTGRIQLLFTKILKWINIKGVSSRREQHIIILGKKIKHLSMTEKLLMILSLSTPWFPYLLTHFHINHTQSSSVVFSHDSEPLQILFLLLGQLPFPANYQSFKDQGPHSQEAFLTLFSVQAWPLYMHS